MASNTTNATSLPCNCASTKCQAYHSSHYRKAGSADPEDPQQENARFSEAQDHGKTHDGSCCSRCKSSITRYLLITTNSVPSCTMRLITHVSTLRLTHVHDQNSHGDEHDSHLPRTTQNEEDPLPIRLTSARSAERSTMIWFSEGLLLGT